MIHSVLTATAECDVYHYVFPVYVTEQSTCFFFFPFVDFIVVCELILPQTKLHSEIRRTDNFYLTRFEASHNHFECFARAE